MAGNNLLDFLQGASNSAASNLSAPIDGINWLLRKAGLPVSDKPIGGSDWLAQKGLTAEPQNKIAGLLGEAFGGVAPIVAAAKAPQIAKGLIATEEAAKPVIANAAENYMFKTGMAQPLTVWHGSPHKFDKFDASKIGTGEGAQAYGHGLYLAESPEVANGYRSNLTYKAGEIPKIAGKEVGDYYNVVMDKANRLPPNAAAKEYDKLAMLEDLMGEQATPEMVLANAAQREYPQHAVDWFKKEVVPKYEMPGAMYKVDLPDEHIAKMLDWDKPLSEQHPDVQKALNGIETNFPEIPDFNLRKWMDADPLASTWHNVIQRDLGVEPSAITSTLKDRGVPGIRYLDGVSRADGAGTSNFVVFPGNEGLLTILERNGQPVNQLQKFVYPQEQALLTAQRNAALPVEQGGLGLHPNNTPMERAQAMGFEGDWLHGSAKRGYVDSTDIKQFEKSRIGDSYSADKEGFFVTNHPTEANYYASTDRDYYNKGEGNGAIYPLMMRSEKPMQKVIPKADDTVSYWDNNNQSLIDAAKRMQADSVLLKDATNGRKMGVAFEPEQLRSRFAAFDPMRRDSPDILAGLLPLSMADEDNRNQLRGLLGY